MENHLHLTRDSLDLVCRRLTVEFSNLHLDQELCKSLARDFLVPVQQLLASYADHISTEMLNEAFQYHHHMFQELYRVAHRAHILVERCCEEKWWRILFTQACTSHREEALDIVDDLRWCIAEIEKDSHFPKQPTLGREHFRTLFKGCEQFDRCVLLNKLETLVSNLEKRALYAQSDLQLSKFLLARMKAIPGDQIEASLDYQKFTTKGENCRPLGKGSAGSVFKTDFLSIQCARKEQEACSDVELQDFAKQAVKLSKLSHPHVIKLFGFYGNMRLDEAHRGFFLMELMSGSLYKEMKRCGTKQLFQLRVAVDIMIQMAKGVRYLHENGISHRDLKCDNILVTKLLIPSELASTSYEEYQHIKVTDFDMAKFFTGTGSDWELQSRANVGSTPWRAPECYTERGKGSVVKVNAKRADSYSFAMTCFELLSVENSPFDALPVDGMAEKKRVAIQAGIRPPIPEACPLLLKRLIADCWQNEAPQRPDFDEIHRRLQDVQSVVLTDTLCQRNRQCDGASASLQRRGVSMISTMFNHITCNAANIANKLLKVISPQMHSGITEVVPPSNKEDATLSVTKVVVGLDFGTTHSGVAYATASNPHDIHTISWPSVGEEVYSCKTLTAIYRPAPNGAWVWGYQARKEYASRYGREGDQYFKELKQSLSSLGNELQPVVEYLRKLGSFVLRYLRLYAEEESLRMEHLQWCITVPSDWSSDSRQFRSFSACLEMAGLVQGQAFDMFRESDAAAQHCYMNCFSSALHLERGDGVCVLDIGSGNLQCVFEDWHDVERTQFAYGSTLSSAESLIKEEFLRFIREKVGQVSDVDPSFHDADLEYLKAYPNHSISMPCLKSSLASTDISLKLSSSEWAVVLKPLVDEVVSFLQEQLRKNSSVNLKRLFVVGGYGKNAHLIEEIERSFPAVIVDKSLRNPGSAICKGAVALGMMLLQARTLHSGSSSNTEGGGEETNLDGGTRGADSNQHGQPGSSQPASSQKLNPSTSTYYSSAADSKGKKKSNAKDDLEDVLQEKVLVALDFGTSQMSFAYSNASHPSEITVCEDHQRRTMAFYYEIQGNILCLRSSGQMAKVDCEANIPGEYVSEPKLHVLVDDHDPELELNLPTGLTIDDVISDSLREYGEFILQVLQEKFGESFELQHIQWCLLVPSFWGENVKRGMRNCMVNAGLLRGARNVDASPYPLVTVLEAEAASVACIRSLNLSKGMKFMVASIGAGALDMVIHEMIGEADLREVSMSAGGFYGSSCLDLNFLTFLSMRMGAWISNYLKRNPCVLNNLLSQWEQIKVNFFDDCDPSTLVFPKALQDAWRHSKPTSTSAQLESLQLTSEDVKMIFEPVVRTILERMAAQLDQTSTVDALVLVGKFGKSPCLYGHIKHRFCDQVKTVIRLDDSESVVLEGAILFGMQQTIIRSRVAKRTYGLGMSLDFQVGLCSTDEVERFRIDVEKGSHVEVNSCVTSVHKLRSHVQRNMKFTLYSSVDSYPRYTEEESVTKEWDFMVDTLDEEPQVEIILYYGRSAIEIEAKGVKGNLLPVTFVTEAMSQRNVVAPSVARRTYGIGVLNTRVKWDLLKYVKHIDGEDLCDFCFEPYIRRGTQLDYFASRTMFPIRNKQQYLPFRLYSSSETSPVYVTDDAVVEEGMLEIDIRNGLIMDKDREVSVRMWFSRTDIKIRAVALNFAQPEDRKLPIRLSDGEWESQVTLNLTRHLRVVPLPSGALGRLQADSCITSGKMDEECCMKDGTASGTSQDDDIKLKKKGPPVVSSEPTPNAAGASEGQFMSLADLETVQVIGKGAEGVVQLVRHRWTHKTYALKVMEMNIHETVRKQIVQEIKFNQVFQWQCFHVVECYHSFYNNGVMSIVLEYMDGGSLSDILKLQKMIPEPYLAIISKQVLEGLLYLHQVRHIIHRDIKPSNVLINHKGEVKISDFGVSAVLATSMGQRGTYTYMSPERISGGNYAYNSDMWSLGLTLLECALGRFPYQPHGQEEGWLNINELLECIVEQPPPALPTDKFTPEFCSFIAACIQKCPDKRPSAADLLMHPFLKKYSKEEYHLSELFPPLEHPHQSANLAKGVWSPQGNAVKFGVQGHDYESRPGDSSQLANVELARSQLTKGEVKLEVKSGQIEPTLSGDSLGKKGLGYYDLTIAGRMLQDYINNLITSNASPDDKVKMKIQEYNDLRDELEAKKWDSGDSSSSNERLLITPQQRIKLICMLHDYQSVLEPENQAEDQTESKSQDLESELRFQDESSEVPLYISDSDFSHGNVYAVTLTAALDACEKHVHEFNSVLPSVVIFTRLCKYMVGTVSPVAVAKFQRYRIVLDLLHRMDPEDAPIPWNLRNSISFCFESLVGLARRFQLVEELLRKCSSPEWHISALELANVRPRKHVTRWSEFSLSVRDCEWSLDILELAFHALDKLLMQRQYTVKDTSFKWSSAKGRMVLQIPGKLDRLNTADDSLTQMSKEWCVMEEEDRLELVEKLEGLVKYERDRKHPNMIFRRSTNAKKIASFLSEKLQGPTPEVGTYFPYSFSELNHPANLIYLEYLDKGSSGMVTIHDWFGMKVAVKSVRAIGLNRAHFEQEAAVLAMSQHPNVVRLINCWFLEKMSSSSGTGQLVMELMDHDLRSIIESRLIVLPKGSSPFSPMVAIDLMLQIAQAMLYLYDNRILHRDLKTKNVLVNICKPLKLTSRGSDTANTSLMGMPSVSAVLPHTQENYVAKLADFGLTRCRPASSYVTTAMAGTAGWRAPEIFHVPDSELAIENVYKWPADVYSFGMTAYEIFTGKLPFEDEPNHSLHGKIMAGERPPFANQDFPGAVKELIQDCWATDPNDRPNFKDIVKRLWECKVLAILPGFERKIMQTASAPASGRLFH